MSIYKIIVIKYTSYEMKMHQDKSIPNSKSNVRKKNSITFDFFFVIVLVLLSLFLKYIFFNEYIPFFLLNWSEFLFKSVFKISFLSFFKELTHNRTYLWGQSDNLMHVYPV